MKDGDNIDVGDKYDKIMKLAVRRGFYWPSYEIYGGVSGFFDLGPLGVRLKNNIVGLWRKVFIELHQDLVVEIETPIIAPEVVFKASGHVESFTDPIVECVRCGRKFRADHLIEAAVNIKTEGLSVDELTRIIRENDIRCPSCQGPLSEVRTFNLLFKTTIGPYSDNVGYLRPEAAQGMFVSFKRVREAMRNRFPIGIAQIGRVSRNEISPRQGMIRLREFTIMEIEFFFDPDDPRCDLLYRVEDRKINILTADMRREEIQEPQPIKISEAVDDGVIKIPWQAYWMGVSDVFAEALGVDKDNIYFEEKLPHERAHYAQQVFDQMVKVSRWGWIEISGHAYRTDYDLSRHIKFSNQSLEVVKTLDKPMKITEKKIKIDKLKIIERYGGESSKIFRALSKVDPSEIHRYIDNNTGKILINDVEIDPDIIVVEEHEKEIKTVKFIPHVVEPSFGAERLLYIVLDNSYTEDGERVLLRFKPYIAPIHVAVLPLLENDESMVKIARGIYKKLIANGVSAIYDSSGSIGRRYARADEIGVPYAVTVDHQTIKDGTVTIRLRDDRSQIRISEKDLISWIRKETEEQLWRHLDNIMM